MNMKIVYRAYILSIVSFFALSIAHSIVSNFIKIEQNSDISILLKYLIISACIVLLAASVTLWIWSCGYVKESFLASDNGRAYGYLLLMLFLFPLGGGIVYFIHNRIG